VSCVEAHREAGVDLLHVLVVVVMMTAERDRERGIRPGRWKREAVYQVLQGHKLKVTFGTMIGRMTEAIIMPNDI
jgi:hypothetical protein